MGLLVSFCAFFVIFLSQVRSDCTNGASCLVNHWKRFSYEDSLALNMTDCVIQLTSGRNGGAVYFNVSSQPVTITGTSFLSCVATESGGACWLRCLSVQLKEICGNDCCAQIYGHFVYYIGLSQESSTLDGGGILECSPSSNSDSTQGVIHRGNDVPLRISYLNQTECHAYDATGFSSVSNGNLIDYLCYNLANCSGQTAFNRAIEELLMCNFYWNNFPKGLLYGKEQGMKVYTCIFCENFPPGKEIVLEEGSTITFSLFNCVFSGSRPSSAFFQDMGGNRELTTTNSWTITESICPTISASLSFQQSLRHDSSVELLDSAKFSLTVVTLISAVIRFGKSGHVLPSDNFSVSEDFFLTNAIENSQAMRTLTVLHSVPVPESPHLTPSQNDAHQDNKVPIGLVAGITGGVVGVVVIVGVVLLIRTKCTRNLELSEESCGIEGDLVFEDSNAVTSQSGSFYEGTLTQTTDLLPIQLPASLPPADDLSVLNEDFL